MWLPTTFFCCHQILQYEEKDLLAKPEIETILKLHE